MPRAVAVAACVVGSLLILAGFRLSRLGRDARGFARTQGRIVAAHVEELPGPAEQGGPRYRVVIRYGFEARGRTWESEQVGIGSPAPAETADAGEARRLVARRPVGTVVDVWYDLADPRRSVLERATPGVQVIAPFAIGVALVGVGLFALARR